MQQVKESGGRVALAIVIPTYNEIENISSLLDRIAKIVSGRLKTTVRVLIVDDSSPDGTARLAHTAAANLNAKNFHISVLNRPAKQGLGKAYQHGIKHILDIYPQTQYILQMDADFSHNPRYIPILVETANSQNMDLIIGSRYVKGGGTPDWTWNRKILSRGGNLYARLFLGGRITDYTGGYNLYSTAILRRLPLDKLYSDGYSFQIEMKYHASRLTDRIAEVPIVFTDRANGRSKIPRNTIYKSLLLVMLLRFARQLK